MVNKWEIWQASQLVFESSAPSGIDMSEHIVRLNLCPVGGCAGDGSHDEWATISVEWTRAAGFGSDGQWFVYVRGYYGDDTSVKIDIPLVTLEDAASVAEILASATLLGGMKCKSLALRARERRGWRRGARDRFERADYLAAGSPF